MRGHNICFTEEILKIIPKLSLLLLLIWSPESLLSIKYFVLKLAFSGNGGIILR